MKRLESYHSSLQATSPSTIANRLTWAYLYRDVIDWKVNIAIGAVTYSRLPRRWLSTTVLLSYIVIPFPLAALDMCDGHGSTME